MANHKSCQLCKQKKPLCDSHIIPSFVFKWLKDSSATGYLRTSQIPNKREQDGVTEYLLCRDCESRLNSWETPVASEIFLPFHQRQAKNFNYGPWLLKFAVSVSWRVLVYSMINNPSGYSHNALKAMNRAIQTWEDFLLDRCSDVGAFEQHMLFIDGITSTTNLNNLPPNINRYFLRVVDMNICFGKDKPLFVYTKMCAMTLIGFIQYQYPQHWQGTKIHAKGGTKAPGNIKVPIQLWKYIKERVNRSQAVLNALSSRQWAVIGNSYNKDPERAKRSETIRAMKFDSRSAIRIIIDKIKDQLTRRCT